MKRKTRMYEPWGYQDENNYQGAGTILENDLESFFADAKYNKDDNKIHFQNKDGEEVGSLDVNEFVKSDSIVEEAKYEDGKIIIKFTNGDVITINVEELIDENEFVDGLQVIEGQVSVKRNAESDNYFTVDTDGIKIAGIKADIDAEEARATSAETALDEKIDAEIARASGEEQRIDEKIDDEVARAEAAEQALDEKVSVEKGRAETAEANLSRRADTLNDELDAEKTVRESEDVKLDRKINTEIDDRKADVDEEEARAKAAEQALQGAINDEKTRAEAKETALQDSIDAEKARALSAETDLQDAIDLKADKETTYTKEEVDALIAEKEAEIVQIKKDYTDLKEIVAEIGGNVEWGVPADGTFNNMMKKSGTVKLGENTTTSTYAGGITSKNDTTLNLNGKNLTFSGQTTTNPGIMTRGKQKLTIMGKGTIDAAGRIAVEANGADTVINLSGTTGFFAAEPTYVTDRSGGELIYCYLGTINIYAGVFKNNGDDKKFLLNCYDANRADGTAKIVVYGGKFYDFDPGNNTAEGPGTSFLAEGYHTEASTVIEEDVEHTVYTVKKDA